MWPETLRLYEVTRPGIREQLDDDLALLRRVNADPSAAALRFWEAPHVAVVVGRSNRIDREVQTSACDADGIPIVRRESGGGAVVIGPGCLCYSLVLPVPEAVGHLGISGITKAVMHRLAQSLATDDEPVVVCGISDLAVGDRKFCGNSQRWLKRAFLHHGTILYDFDLARIDRYLQPPSRQPDYRRGRPHLEFVTNLRRSRREICERLCRGWNAVPVAFD